LLVVFAIACSTGGKPDEGAPMPPPTAEPAKPMTSQKSPKVIIETPNGEVSVNVEVVSTEAKIERGLMYRQHLPPDDGMLFLLGIVKDWSFWMHNTLIPLDLIFITPDFMIAGIVENAEPRTDTMRKVGIPCLYVLEVNGGWTAAHGVVRGAKVRFADVPRGP
jgi:uncharacterized membrane protein (UPF0127 family)